MLSPSMITKSKGNWARYLAISAAVSYWPFSPVPLSPITAKRIEFGFSGSFNSGGEAGVSAARKSRMEKMHRIVKSRNRVGNEIDDQVGLDVAENQGTSYQPII